MTMSLTGEGGSSRRPLVSVVTPFDNTASFLEEAIRSVLAQGYDRFEYILADNCSTDGSLEIAQRFAAQDSRIRVVTHTEFVEQDLNYNRALRYISPESEYCKVVQADDWIFPTCLGEMLALAEQHPAVGIVGCCYLAGDALAGHGLPFDRLVFSGREACRARLLDGGTFFGSPTSLLYRSTVVRSRPSFYEEHQLNADTMACFEALAEMDFGRVRQILAYLRRGNSSISQRYERLEASYFVNYALVQRYGQQYLSAAEFRRRRSTLEREYHRALARAVVKGREQEYWEFHASLLGSLGMKLPQGGIALQLGDLALAKMLNLRQTIEGAVSALRR
jgi:glycosyltransferase involved in cell wall biosynthesis